MAIRKLQGCTSWVLGEFRFSGRQRLRSLVLVSLLSVLAGDFVGITGQTLHVRNYLVNNEQPVELGRCRCSMKLQKTEAPH